MIEIIDQEMFLGKVYDTTLHIEYDIVIEGGKLSEFERKIEELIDEYRI